MNTKICTKCSKEKDILEFWKDSTKKDGYRPSCIECCLGTEKYNLKKKKQKLNKLGQKECTNCYKVKLLSEFSECDFYKDNHSTWCKKCVSKNGKGWYKDNIDYAKIKHKEYYEANKNEPWFIQMRKENRKKWELNNPNYDPPNKKEYNKKYYEENKKAIMEQKRLYMARKAKEDIMFVIKKNLRTRIWEVLKRNSKSKRTMELLGCTVEEFKTHLQSLFTQDMTWDNYGRGGWEMDHIKPCALFDLCDPKQQEECFNYKNIQPMWAKDNRKKSDKLDYVSETK